VSKFGEHDSDQDLSGCAGASGSTFAGSGLFSGWAIDMRHPLPALRWAIDGASAGKASYGVSRRMFAGFSGRSNCPNVAGHSTRHHAVEHGTHTLAVTAAASMDST